MDVLWTIDLFFAKHVFSIAKTSMHCNFFNNQCYTDTGIGIGTGTDIQCVGTESVSVSESVPELISDTKFNQYAYTQHAVLTCLAT